MVKVSLKNYSNLRSRTHLLRGNGNGTFLTIRKAIISRQIAVFINQFFSPWYQTVDRSEVIQTLDQFSGCITTLHAFHNFSQASKMPCLFFRVPYTPAPFPGGHFHLM